jgi:hypothetical protein
LHNAAPVWERHVARQLIDRASFSEASTARSCSTVATLSSARRLTKGGFLSAFCRASTNGRKVVNGVERQLGDAACATPGAESQAGGRIISQRFETFRRAARTLRIAAKPKCSILNKASHVDHLSDQIKGLREKAEGLPAGDERNALLRKAEQDEIALRLIEWITSPGQLSPPEDLIPIRRHRLRRE